MIVKLNIALRVNTEQLYGPQREWAIDQCQLAGFPVTEENIAWYVAEAVAEEAASMGIQAEVSA